MKNTSYTSNNELVLKRRKKKAKKKFLFFTIFLLVLLIALCFKLPYFNITNIEVLNNKNLSNQDIIKIAAIPKGQNIFNYRLSKSKQNIMNNPYILDVNLYRKLPNTIKIDVKERKMFYFVKFNNKFLVVDSKGVVIEARDNINNMSLVNLEGVEAKNYTVGKVLPGLTQEKLRIAEDMADLLSRENNGVPQMIILDLSSETSIKALYGSMVVILGTRYDLENKLNKALNILQQGNVNTSKGYIDVSFNGNPVVSIQK